MRAKKTGRIFRILSITILIINILIITYGIILTARNNLFDIVLFLVLVSISIITIRIVHDTLELVKNCCRSFLDTDYIKEHSDIKSLLEKGTISKEEANKRRDEILSINNDYGNTINTYEILFKTSIIVFILSILFLLTEQLFCKTDYLINPEYQIYVIIAGIISQALILTFSKITECIFFNGKPITMYNSSLRS